MLHDSGSELRLPKHRVQVVKGSGGTIFALGDAATIQEDKALDHAAELFRHVCNAAPVCGPCRAAQIEFMAGGLRWVGLPCLLAVFIKTFSGWFCMHTKIPALVAAIRRQGDVNGDGVLTCDEIQHLMASAQKQYPQVCTLYAHRTPSCCTRSVSTSRYSVTWLVRLHAPQW